MSVTPALFFCDNLFDVLAYPLHVVTASEEATGHEAWRIADGRRSAFDYWAGSTANNAQWVQTQCDRVRGANCLFLDRGSNLLGFEVLLQASQDGSTWVTVLDITIPTASVTNVVSDTAYGVVTEEGAWWVSFPMTAALYWRLYVPAMGAGLIPQVVGLKCGMSYQPTNGLGTPWGDGVNSLQVQEVVTPYAFRGRGPRGVAKQFEILYRLYTDDEFDLARYHIEQYFGRGRPMVICYDQSQADRAFVAVRPNGQLGYVFDGREWPKTVRISYVESDPLSDT